MENISSLAIETRREGNSEVRSMGKTDNKEGNKETSRFSQEQYEMLKPCSEKIGKDFFTSNVQSVSDTYNTIL